MDKSQAKQLLLSHRHDDPSDPQMMDALSLLKNDPELQTWYAEQKRFNDTVRAKLHEISVPKDLGKRILASRKVIPIWQTPWVKLAAAAAIVVLLTVAGMIWKNGSAGENSISGFQNRMVAFALREYRMDVVSEDRQVIRSFLAGKGAPMEFTLPSAIENLRPMGGASLSWQGKPVAMLCFRLSKDDTAYLFVMQDRPKATEVSATPELGTTKGLNTIRWKQGNTVFFLAAHLPKEDLQRLVERAQSRKQSRSSAG